MNIIIGIDVASEVSSFCVLGKNGAVKQEKMIETHISKIKKFIKQFPRPRQVVFEEGAQAAWLWSELESVCDDILVCDPREASKLSKQFKSDKNDARNLSRLAHAGLLKRVWHGGRDLQSLKESVRAYQNLTEQSTRLKNQIRAVFRSRGIKVGQKAYNPKERIKATKDLPHESQKIRVKSLGEVLDIVTEQRAKALKTMVKNARANKMYKFLRRIDGIGPIFAAMFIAEVGDPERFRTRQQLWSYAGLAIETYESSEFELVAGRIKRKSRALKTRGLVRAYNRTLKYVFKQAALILSRTKWKKHFALLVKRSKNSNNALLTFARKISGVMLHIAKTGEKYDINKVFNAQLSQAQKV